MDLSDRTNLARGPDDAPSPEHYLPLLYVPGTRRPDERIAFPVEGIDGGSLSMLSVQAGGSAAV